MSFKKNKFLIEKNVLAPDVAQFIYEYFLLKRKTANTFFKTNYIPLNSPEWGTWKDAQVPNTYSIYGDILMEVLLAKILPFMEKKTKLKLSPNYSYARIYKKGDVLKRHKDRFSCEISTTLNLGGDPWPIYLSPKENVGVPNLEKGITTSSNVKGIKVNLKPGDMLIYRGMELEHWREEFIGENCAQVFLHYNDLSNKKAKNNLFDNRIHLGLPKLDEFIRKI
jgi:hypothetical protein